MNQTQDIELAAAQEWLRHECHRAGVHHALERGLEYLEAVERAGLPPNAISGDDLYAFLTDPAAERARMNSFVLPTL